MSKNTNTRAMLAIDAIASASAGGNATALSPERRYGHVAALAGFILRLFRRTGPAVPILGRIRTSSEGRVQRERRESEADTKPTRCRSGAGAERTRSETEAPRASKSMLRSSRSRPAEPRAALKGGLRHG